MLANDNNHVMIKAATKEIGILVKTGDVYVPVYVPCVHHTTGKYLLTIQEHPVTYFVKDLPFWYEKAVFHNNVQRLRKFGTIDAVRLGADKDTMIEVLWWGERNVKLNVVNEDHIYTKGFQQWLITFAKTEGSALVAWYTPSPEGDGIMVSYIKITEDQYQEIEKQFVREDGFDIDDSLPKHLSELSHDELLDLVTNIAPNYVGVDTVKSVIEKIKKTK